MKIIYLSIYTVFLLFFLFLLHTPEKIYANTLGSASDIISTSRPSPSTPLSADATAPVGNVSVVSNGSTFLASDSAILYGSLPETVTIATVSAAKTSLFFTSTTANSHASGSVIAVPVTATHTVTFTLSNSLPITGSITLTFPSSISTDTNVASPSGATFMPNNLNSANIKTSNGNVSCSLNSFSAGSSPTITCNNANSSIAGGTTITILIGCNSGTTVCPSANQVPTLINPTKTANAGSADIWSLKISTFSNANGSGSQLDNTTVKIGTVESINIVAHIDPIFTVTIAGVNDGTSINTAAYCGTSHAADTSNTGFPTTSTDVNLGTLKSSQINRALQTITISSNAISGYTLIATTSGHLLNPASGVFIPDAQGSPTNNDTPVPMAMTAGTAAFGLHACDANNKVSIAKWGQAIANFANPSASFYYTLVSSNTVPQTSGDKIVLEYASTPATTTSPGDYRTQLTYIVTVTF